MELHEKIRRMLASQPDAPAIEFNGCWHPRRELALIAERLDAALVIHGLGPGTRVGLIARNRPPHLGVFAALLATRRCAVMIYSAQDRQAIARDISQLKLPVIVADREDWSEQAIAAAAEAGTLGLALTHDPENPVVKVPGLEAIGANVLNAGDPEVAMELLSSGTTGAPKRIPLLARTLDQAVIDAASAYASGRGENGISLPAQVVFHPLGNVAGVTFVIPFLIDGHPLALLERFRLGQWLDAVRRHRPARASLPPAVLRTILDEKIVKEDLASFASIGVGAAPLDPELQEQFEQTYGIPLLAGYGATEFCGVVANWTLDLYREFGRIKRGSVGRPRPGVELRIINPDSGGGEGEGGSSELPVNATGLVEARVQRVSNAWIRTTDLGYIDGDGFLYLCGRADHAINRGGFKILPDEVARVLRQHPKVADAAVIGIADARLGQVPVAALEIRANEEAPAESELAAFARARLAAYQIPVRFLIVDALPRNPSMKVSVPQLTRLFEASSVFAPAALANE